MSAKNPLTGRVLANRLWAAVFGRGIVPTLENFGTQGEPPSHPKLLDWLALELPRRGWSLKSFERLLVTSAVYRQSSRLRPDLQEKDPENRLLARGPRFRLDGEFVRDLALAASGLLSTKIGGPSVMPPQPEGVWQVVYSGDRWVTSPGADRYRRALYTFWRRTSPYPSLIAFDATSREYCTLRRVRTNTPLQALVTLNDPAFVEAAGALARRMLREGGDGPAERVRYGFRLVVAREPREAEIARLAGLYEKEAAWYRAHREDAAELAGVSSEPVPEGTEDAEIAAWTVVANVLLNLDETLNKN